MFTVVIDYRITRYNYSQPNIKTRIYRYIPCEKIRRLYSIFKKKDISSAIICGYQIFIEKLIRYRIFLYRYETCGQNTLEKRNEFNYYFSRTRRELIIRNQFIFEYIE